MERRRIDLSRFPRIRLGSGMLSMMLLDGRGGGGMDLGVRVGVRRV